ncbi:hypothetical protein B0H11DRAFT_2251639 [Mycena galericulata]|nr:hypothetical protein B0H11DRAFT_2251639 [Mycena galericulata]
MKGGATTHDVKTHPLEQILEQLLRLLDVLLGQVREPSVQEIEFGGDDVTLVTRRQVVRHLARLRQGIQAPIVPIFDETQDRTDIIYIYEPRAVEDIVVLHPSYRVVFKLALEIINKKPPVFIEKDVRAHVDGGMKSRWLSANTSSSVLVPYALHFFLAVSIQYAQIQTAAREVDGRALVARVKPVCLTRFANAEKRELIPAGWGVNASQRMSVKDGLSVGEARTPDTLDLPLAHHAPTPHALHSPHGAFALVVSLDVGVRFLSTTSQTHAQHPTAPYHHPSLHANSCDLSNPEIVPDSYTTQPAASPAYRRRAPRVLDAIRIAFRPRRRGVRRHPSTRNSGPGNIHSLDASCVYIRKMRGVHARARITLHPGANHAHTRAHTSAPAPRRRRTLRRAVNVERYSSGGAADAGAAFPSPSTPENARGMRGILRVRRIAHATVNPWREGAGEGSSTAQYNVAIAHRVEVDGGCGPRGWTTLRMIWTSGCAIAVDPDALRCASPATAVDAERGIVFPDSPAQNFRVDRGAACGRPRAPAARLPRRPDTRYARAQPRGDAALPGRHAPSHAARGDSDSAPRTPTPPPRPTATATTSGRVRDIERHLDALGARFAALDAAAAALHSSTFCPSPSNAPRLKPCPNAYLFTDLLATLVFPFLTPSANFGVAQRERDQAQGYCGPGATRGGHVLGEHFSAATRKTPVEEEDSDVDPQESALAVPPSDFTGGDLANAHLCEFSLWIQTPDIA